MPKDKIDFYSSTNLKSYNLDDIMKYQLSMLDRMDMFTRRHSENVANLTCRVCEYLHCSKSFTVHATICGYLHDIGKLAIPSEILNKPGKLTDEEFEIMKTHTTIGYEMCMKDLKLRPYATAALYHHEALNGSGYPNGVTKKDLPYIGQIVRVADEYDAITAKRQYKTHVDISQTLKILIDEAGPRDTKKIIALNHLKKEEKVGKIDAGILRILFKVVVDDIYYEIASTEGYIEYLKGELKRLSTANKYYEKMLNAKKEKDKKYFENGVTMLLSDGESIDNFKSVVEEYQNALAGKETVIKKLHDEIKIIRKLKI